MRSVLPDCECKDKANFLFRKTFFKKNYLFQLFSEVSPTFTLQNGYLRSVNLSE